MYYRLIFIVGAICFVSTTSMGQYNPTSYFLSEIYQQKQTNPAFFQDSGFVLSLPAINFNVNQIGPKYNDIVKQNTEGNYIIDATSLATNSEDENIFRTYLNIPVLNFGFAAKQHNFDFGLSFKLLGLLNYPKELAAVYANGNGPFIGQNINIGPEFQLSLYNEWSFGYAYKKEKLSFGARIKLLNGLEDVSTKDHSINLLTDDDIYRLTFNNDFLINTSSLLDIEDLGNITFNFEGIEDVNFFTSNLGFAFDLGITYKINEKFTASFSVIDIGKINWDENVTNYLSSGAILFDGIDLVSIIRDSTEIILVDTLYNILEFQESNDNYSNSLPIKFYAGLDHRLNDKFSFGYLLFLEMFKGHSFEMIGVNANYAISKRFHIGSSISFNSKSQLGIGLQGSLQAGFFQIYGGTANLLGLVSPKSASRAQATFGINLLF